MQHDSHNWGNGAREVNMGRGDLKDTSIPNGKVRLTSNHFAKPNQVSSASHDQRKR